MDEKKVVVVVIGTKEEEEEETWMNTKKNIMIEGGGGEKLRLMVVGMSAWCVLTFCWFWYLMMLAVWDTNLVRAILSTIPFLLAFLVHLLCLYLYLSDKISSFVANPQTTTGKQIPTLILLNYLPLVTIYILVHCFVLYHISDEVTPEDELKCIVAYGVMSVFWSNGMVFRGYFTIEQELESYQVKQQQSAATTTPIDQQHMTEGGEEKKKLMEMVKHTSSCCFLHVLGYLLMLILVMWPEEEMVDMRLLRAAVLYLIPILFILLVTLIWLHRYVLDSINKSFDEINPQSTTTRERIVVGNAKKHFASTAITFGVHLFILYIMSDEVTRKKELLQLLLTVGFLISMSFLQLIARFSYIRLSTCKTQVV